ncbi:MAG TPA: hypothetical protein VF487_00020 [Chitinophagaceae bacterium]
MDQKITQFLTSMGYIAIPLRQNVAGQLLINAMTLYLMQPDL